MKAIIYTLVITFLISSCNTIEKMVQKGQYDEAFTYSVNYMRRAKKRKLKYVKAMEESYRRLNERDLATIERLTKSYSASDWEVAINFYDRINNRQRLVSGLIPLTSKEGYTATFDINNFSEDVQQLHVKLADFYYKRGSNLLKGYSTKDKGAARQAFRMFGRCRKHIPNFKDVRLRMKDAKEKGIVHIAVEYIDASGLAYGRDVLEKLNGNNLNKLNTTWKRFYPYREGEEYDYYVVFQLHDIYFGTNEEYVDRVTHSKKIHDGYDIIVHKTIVKEEIPNTVQCVTLKDKNGKVKNEKKYREVEKIVEEKVERYIEVYADVVTITRSKTSNLDAIMMVYNATKEQPEYKKDIACRDSFCDKAQRVEGDSRAVPGCVGSSFISDFPSRYAIVNNLGSRYQQVVIKKIKKYNFLK